MTTIVWKTAAPFGTCRSRYKARRAAAVAARLREKKLIRRIGILLDGGESTSLSQKMRGAFPAGQHCPHCGLPGPGNARTCSFCSASAQSLSGR